MVSCPFAELSPSQSFWHQQRPQPVMLSPARLRRIQNLAETNGGLVYSAQWKAWLVTGYAATNDIFRSSKMLSTSWSSDDKVASRGLSLLRHMMLFNNAATHRRLRSVAEQAFSPRKVAEQEQLVSQTLAEILEPLRGQQRAVDIVAEVSQPFAIRVILKMLGLTRKDENKLLKWSASMVQLVGGANPTPQLLAAIEHDAQQLQGYFGHLAEQLRSKPQAGLLSELANSHTTEGHHLSNDELLANAVLLLAAGHEAVSNLIPSALLELAQQPVAWQQLLEQPDHPNIADELLRLVSPAQVDGRIVNQDVQIQGQQLRSGQFAQLLIGAANRDPAVFAFPQRLDWQRSNSARHLAFATGPHFCLGAALARLEISTFFKAFASHFPNYHIVQKPTFKPNVLIHGPEALWVRLV